MRANADLQREIDSLTLSLKSTEARAEKAESTVQSMTATAQAASIERQIVWRDECDIFIARLKRASADKTIDTYSRWLH